MAISYLLIVAEREEWGFVKAIFGEIVKSDKPIQQPVKREKPDEIVFEVKKVSDLMKHYQQYHGWADAKVNQVCKNYVQQVAEELQRKNVGLVQKFSG